ncbi:MAG: hypothetical protein N3A71_03765 [Candidatus Dojkabacteria bacterium]|nr:hypothetical protein [Candidatus Dojkabacteria bacterium]
MNSYSGILSILVVILIGLLLGLYGNKLFKFAFPIFIFVLAIYTVLYWFDFNINILSIISSLIVASLLTAIGVFLYDVGLLIISGLIGYFISISISGMLFPNADQNVIFIANIAIAVLFAAIPVIFKLKEWIVIILSSILGSWFVSFGLIFVIPNTGITLGMINITNDPLPYLTYIGKTIFLSSNLIFTILFIYFQKKQIK